MICTGVVKAVNGTSPGPASGITYDIAVNYPDGRSVVYSNVAPTQPRWPDAVVDTIASPVGTPIIVSVVGGKLWFQLIELPRTEACG